MYIAKRSILPAVLQQPPPAMVPSAPTVPDLAVMQLQEESIV